MRQEEQRLATLYVLRAIDDGCKLASELTTPAYLRSLSRRGLIDPGRPVGSQRTWELTCTGRRYLRSGKMT